MATGSKCRLAGVLAVALIIGWPIGSARADGVTVLLDDSFEGTFPLPPWRVEHPAGAAAVDWGRSAHRVSDGGASLYCAADGDAAPGDGGPAPADTASWAVVGPFDLSETASGVLAFDLWLRTERYQDVFMWLVSTDGVTFNGSARTADTDGWRTVTTDLAHWGAAGSVLGHDTVWIAFVYQSDHSNLFEGAYLDRVRLTVDYGTPGEQGRTYTSDADFRLGAMVGTESSSGRLQLSEAWDALPYLWVPNSDTGTVSKLSAESGNELARYATGASDDVDPGVAAVGLDGACWVGNRAAGTVVRIGLDENGGCVDRDGDGSIDTSRDHNGDGAISGSELLDWGDDECVLVEVVLVKGREGLHVPGDGHGDAAGNGLQAVAVDPSGDVWAGVQASRMLYRLDGASGAILDSFDLAADETSPSALAVTPDGTVWAASWPDTFLLGLDPATSVTTRVPLAHRGRRVAAGGADRLYVTGYEDGTVSRVDPTTGQTAWLQYPGRLANGVATTSDGAVWVAAPGEGAVSRFGPQGVLSGLLWLAGGPTGLAVDQDGKVWVLSSSSESVFRLDPAGFRAELEAVVAGGGGHRATGDLTGIVARNLTSRFGSWTVVYDSGTSATPWGTLTWQGSEPAGSEIAVRVRSSSDRDAWSAWEPADDGVELAATPPGRYLQIQATLHRISGTELPTLSELTVTPAVVQNPPVASFNWAPDGATAGVEVSFTDTSTGDPSAWSWHFGDGDTSDVQNPSHTYGAAGSYQVSLTASNGGGSDTVSQTLSIGPAVGCSLSCSATAPPTAPVGEPVVFQSTAEATGCTGPTVFAWDFGDGATSAEQSPSHAYDATGTRRWQLTASVDETSCRAWGDLTVTGDGPTECSTTLWVPVASHADGVNGSVWRTDLGLLGIDVAAVAVELRLHADDGVVARVVTVAPLAMVNLADVVEWIDPGRSGSGALEVCADGALVVTSRTANVLGSDEACFPGGSFGQFLAGDAPAGGLAAGEQAWLGQLRESEAFRTNIGVVNTGAEPATVEVRLHDATGAELVVFRVELEPGRWTQDSRPLSRRAGRTDLDAASARVSVIEGDGVFAYASVIDNRTNDATTVPMRR